jgi:steroid 5-alpha reductase family enzyme
MTHFLWNISGKLLERSLLRNRRAYANYVAETSAFIPRAPKAD